jgi:mycothiol system anti-sigma-R factor
MNCQDFLARLHPYVDGELAVEETAAASQHASECRDCGARFRDEQAFRQFLRRQPQEAASAEFRARIAARLRAERRRRLTRPWLIAPVAAGALAATVVMVITFGVSPTASLVDELVDKHNVYAQVNHPAELATDDRLAIERWFAQRADLRVVVPDYSAASIRLVGARLAETRDRKTVYLLYEKGSTLLSVFMVPRSPREGRLGGTTVAYRGHNYLTRELKGYRTVAWRDEHATFGLVSMLDNDAILECADRLRVERAAHNRL